MERNPPRVGWALAALASILPMAAAACSKNEGPGSDVSSSDTAGWWNDWKAEAVEFPEGTRFEFETIYTDGSRGTRVLVVQAVEPGAAGGFNVTLGEGVSSRRWPIPPPIPSGGPIQTRDKKLVEVTTPAATFLAGRLWLTETRGGPARYETDTWVVPGIPLPVQIWSRPATAKHLSDPPRGDTIPAGTFLERLVRIEKP